MIKNQPVSLKHIVSQNEGNIVSDMDGEKVMLSIKNGKYYNLGEIGGAIWELVEEPVVIEEVIYTLLSEYDVTHEECKEHVFSFLTRLSEEGLVKLEDPEAAV
ncbi:lasso peptide biosynthesis PqqD family chaperone [Salipaludibacillus sp. CUR1]|uniref:lasso peptide biosynthesis PqqD family chaperone n=1 Tax=Salipaludibacillus sp. CUR1 TaxID=2820003 RepID=UPI001E40E9C1|nr:lasso peptide biosynthesis PqqD family chaperone [Salipaludibacillus sp. CUR1]MCE7792758.1 lasso peptide biosynthesis PqqD family chaperone [Salipaludibacillus sp. CUR1]